MVWTSGRFSRHLNWQCTLCPKVPGVMPIKSIWGVIGWVFVVGKHGASEPGFWSQKKATFWQPLSHGEEAEDRKSFDLASHLAPSVIIRLFLCKSNPPLPSFLFNSVVSLWLWLWRFSGKKISFDLIRWPNWKFFGNSEAAGMWKVWVHWKPIAEVNQYHFPNKMTNGNKCWGFGGARLASVHQDSPPDNWQTPLGNGRKAQEARNLEKWSQSGQKMKGGHAGVVGSGSVDQPHIGQIPPLVMLGPWELIGDHT